MSFKLLCIISFFSINIFSSNLSIEDFNKFIVNSKFKNCTVTKSKDSSNPVIKYVKDGQEISKEILLGYYDYNKKFSKHLFTRKYQINGYEWAGEITKKYTMKLDGKVINLPTGYAGSMEKYGSLKSLKLSSSSNSLFGIINSVMSGNTIYHCRK